MNSQISERWQRNCLRLALEVASQSKDPTTKVGACIFSIDPVPSFVSGGFNGFAHGVADSPARMHDRATKYRLTLHAEQNAILFAKGNLTDTAMFVTRPPCAQCASWIAQSKVIAPPGIRLVYALRGDDAFMERWADDIETAGVIFEEAGIEFILLDGLPGGD